MACLWRAGEGGITMTTGDAVTAVRVRSHTCHKSCSMVSWYVHGWLKWTCDGSLQSSKLKHSCWPPRDRLWWGVTDPTLTAHCTHACESCVYCYQFTATHLQNSTDSRASSYIFLHVNSGHTGYFFSFKTQKCTTRKNKIKAKTRQDSAYRRPQQNKLRLEVKTHTGTDKAFLAPQGNAVSKRRQYSALR